MTAARTPIGLPNTNPAKIPQAIGEFSFVLGSIAFAQEAITESQYTGLLVAVVISIVASSLLVRKVGLKPTDKN